MLTRIEAIGEILDTYTGVAAEFGDTLAEAARIKEEGREALRALGVTDAEIRQAEVG